MVLRRGMPAFYSEGARIEMKLRRYKWAQEEVLETLRLLSSLISNIDGKLEEVNRCMYGDMRLQVTSIRLFSFSAGNLVIGKKDAKGIRYHVAWYNKCVKEERFADASVPLIDLKKILMKVRQKKAVTFGVDPRDIEQKSHTPIVIKARKRGE